MSYGTKLTTSPSKKASRTVGSLATGPPGTGSRTVPRGDDRAVEEDVRLDIGDHVRRGEDLGGRVDDDVRVVRVVRRIHEERVQLPDRAELAGFQLVRGEREGHRLDDGALVDL